MEGNASTHGCRPGSTTLPDREPIGGGGQWTAPGALDGNRIHFHKEVLRQLPHQNIPRGNTPFWCTPSDRCYKASSVPHACRGRQGATPGQVSHRLFSPSQKWEDGNQTSTGLSRVTRTMRPHRATAPGRRPEQYIQRERKVQMHEEVGFVSLRPCGRQMW